MDGRGVGLGEEQRLNEEALVERLAMTIREVETNEVHGCEKPWRTKCRTGLVETIDGTERGERKHEVGCILSWGLGGLYWVRAG